MYRRGTLFIDSMTRHNLPDTSHSLPAQRCDRSRQALSLTIGNAVFVPFACANSRDRRYRSADTNASLFCIRLCQLAISRHNAATITPRADIHASSRATPPQAHPIFSPVSPSFSRPLKVIARSPAMVPQATRSFRRPAPGKTAPSLRARLPRAVVLVAAAAEGIWGGVRRCGHRHARLQRQRQTGGAAELHAGCAGQVRKRFMSGLQLIFLFEVRNAATAMDR